MTKAKYFLVQNNKQTDLEEFAKLLSSINSQNGVGVIPDEKSKRKATIYYATNGFRADIKLTTGSGVYGLKKFKLPSRKVLVSSEIADNLTINMIKDLATLLGFRVFSIDLKAYLPKDPNLYDCATGLENYKDVSTLKSLGFKALFWFWNSYSYYAKSFEDKKIHFINGYMLKHFIEKKETILSPEFSYIVANDIHEFVNFFDQGLIPVDFYKFYNKDLRIISNVYLDIHKPERDIYLKPAIYKYSKYENQYKKVDVKEDNNWVEKVLKGENIENKIEDILKNKFNKNEYKRVFISKEVEFLEKERTLTPKLQANIYL